MLYFFLPSMKIVILSTGILITCLLILFKLAKISYINSAASNIEYILIIFGIVCLVAGLLLRKKTVVIIPAEKPLEAEIKPFSRNKDEIEKLSLSKREIEILDLINEGLSNQQIAERLFVSESTVKKHVSNILLKMDVGRRTEAIRKGKDIGILQ